LTVIGGQAQFGKPRSPAASTTQLLEDVRQVRNNLFHGNKLFATNCPRDRVLMVEAVGLIDLIMEDVPELRRSFSEPQR